MANIVRWDDPFAGLSNLHGQIDDMFNNFLRAPMTSIPQSVPSMDVYTEDDKQLVAEVNAPGFTKDDIDVSVHNGVLEIKGEKHERDETGQATKRNYMMRESHASFYRRLALPDYADQDNVDAEFQDGVLKVVVPFKELPQPKKVVIGDGSKKR